MLLYIKWKLSLEPVYCHESDTIGEVRRRFTTKGNVPLEHKLLVHHGLLLQDEMTLTTSGIRDGSTLHLILNGQSFKGKPMLVATSHGTVANLSVTDAFKIEDIKEEVFAYPNEPAPESQVLIFVGKQLENDRTLREYNIQKGSCLRVINASFARSEIQSFVRATSPCKDAVNVALNAHISIQFTAIEEDERQYWGQYLGSPDLSTLLPQQLQVREKNAFTVVAGEVSVDSWTRTVTFVPSKPLRAETHYQVVLNRPAASLDGGQGLRHSRGDKLVEGVMRWSFFTVGYQPLRVLSVYPPPFSTVSAEGCKICLVFSGRLHPDCVERGARDWLRVRTSDGHTMLDPAHDPDAGTLVFESSRPFTPGDVVRVRLLCGLVVGDRFQSMLPVQPAGLVKTAPFLWQFNVAHAPPYQRALRSAFSVAHLFPPDPPAPYETAPAVSRASGFVPKPMLAAHLPSCDVGLDALGRDESREVDLVGGKRSSVDKGRGRGGVDFSGAMETPRSEAAGTATFGGGGSAGEGWQGGGDGVLASVGRGLFEMLGLLGDGGHRVQGLGGGAPGGEEEAELLLGSSPMRRRREGWSAGQSPAKFTPRTPRQAGREGGSERPTPRGSEERGEARVAKALVHAARKLDVLASAGGDAQGAGGPAAERGRRVAERDDQTQSSGRAVPGLAAERGRDGGGAVKRSKELRDYAEHGPIGAGAGGKNARSRQARMLAECGLSEGQIAEVLATTP